MICEPLSCQQLYLEIRPSETNTIININIYTCAWKNNNLSSPQPLDTLVDCKDPWWLSSYYDGMNMPNVFQ